MDRLGAAGAGQGNGAATQHIGEQVRERTVGAHGHALAIDVVVLGGRGGPASEHRLAVAIEGDGIGDASVVHALQHAIAFVVVEEAISCYGAAGRRPTARPGELHMRTTKLTFDIGSSGGGAHAPRTEAARHHVDGRGLSKGARSTGL